MLTVVTIEEGDRPLVTRIKGEERDPGSIGAADLQCDRLNGAGSPDCEYLTVDQVANMLQVSTKSVSRWVSHDPSMPALRIGRTLRFERARLLAWLRSKTQGFGRPRAHGRAQTDLQGHANL